MYSYTFIFPSRLIVQQSAWNSQGDLEQAAEPLPVEFSEELPLMQDPLDRTQPMNSSNPSSEEDDEENVNEKEQHDSSSVSNKLSSVVKQDGRCLSEQLLSTVEGN